MKKKTFTAEYNETFEFEVDTDGVSSDLVFQAYDWDLASAHDLIGEAIVSRARLADVVRAKETWEGEDMYILQRDGKRVLGSDHQQTTLTIRMAVIRPRPYFDTLQLDDSAQGPRKLGITVVRCRNLPKCDTFGTCDAYVEVIYEGVMNKTKVMKDSYAPDFNETFDFDIAEAKDGCSQNVIVRVYDWNSMSASELVGECIIPASRMSEIIKAKLGWEGDDVLMLSISGKPVVGHNEHRSEVMMKMRVLKAPKAFEELEIDEECSGSRRLQVTMVSSKHLPKMDTLGKVDAYCILFFEDIEMRTRTIKNTYEPEWNETLTWGVWNVEQGCKSDFRCVVMDWDVGSNDDEVGSFTIPAFRMAEIVRARIGWEGE